MTQLTKTIDILESHLEPLNENRLIVEGKINRDDAFGDIQSRSLEQISPYTFIRKHQPTNFDTICITIEDLVRGSSSYTYHFEDTFGEPLITYGTNDDVPVDDLSLTPESVKVYNLVFGLKVTQAEIDAVNVAKLKEYTGNLINRKMRSIVKKMDEKATKVGFYGDPGRTNGLLTDPNVAVDDTAFNFYASTSATDIADNFLGYFYDVWAQTNTVEEIDTILIPPLLLKKFNTTRTTSGTVKTAKELIKDGLDDFNVTLLKRPELSGVQLRQAGVLGAGTTKDMMLFYKRGVNPPDEMGNVYPDVERHSSGLYSYPWEYTGATYKTRVIQSFTPVKFNYAGSAIRVTFEQPV